MNIKDPSIKVYQVLRVACAMCLIGHGAFGIITKKIWCNYFAVFGIDEATAYQLMPLVGTMDILLGVIMLVYPIRAVAGWLVFWGIFTASLRPLSGEPFAEFIERAGNYGAPLALLVLTGYKLPLKHWFKKMTPADIDNNPPLPRVKLVLQVAGTLLLAGHGWLNLLEKKGLLNQYAALGFNNVVLTARVTGMLELLGALLILFRPGSSMVLCLLVWKMISELFYPNYAIFEWVERGGSYGLLLALWFIVMYEYRTQRGGLLGEVFRTNAIAK